MSEAKTPRRRRKSTKKQDQAAQAPAEAGLGDQTVKEEASAAVVETAKEAAPAEVTLDLTKGPEDEELGCDVIAVEAAAQAPKKARARLDSANPDDVEMSIEDAASSMVDGYKESWLPAIRAKARSMGIGDKASRRTWRGVFIAWGSASILR